MMLHVGMINLACRGQKYVTIPVFVGISKNSCVLPKVAIKLDFLLLVH